ncbi:MAG: AAA family ATPase, partial [Caldilineaceae bacterium SB0670_bin_27]|nr:AAA family ATPase [Caldilineaceae bacterium SB0670_bin_27]
MITLVEALNYRCLRYISRPLKPFHVLVGPNASGKTTFLDVVAFLQELVSEGLEAALESRTNNPQDLLFRRNGERFELAVEALIPEGMRKSTARRVLDSVRYEIAIGFDETDRQFEFKAEKLLLKETGKYDTELRSLFPQNLSPPTTLVTPKGKRNVKAVINKVPGGNDNFYSEAYIQSGKGWAPSFRLGTQKSALGNLPEVEKDFPVATWFRELLQSGVQQLVLNSLMIRRPSPPTRVSGFRLDGSNLPWVVAQLREESPERYSEWIAHLQTARTD